MLARITDVPSLDLASFANLYIDGDPTLTAHIIESTHATELIFFRVPAAWYRTSFDPSVGDDATTLSFATFGTLQDLKIV